MRRFWLPVLTSILFDQVSKSMALKLITGPVALVPGLLVLRCVRNPGAAFGLFSDQTPFLVLVSVALGAAVLVGYDKLRSAPAYWQWGLGFLFGGMLGNLIDRLRFGYVVDFVDVGFWPVFNLADAAIVCGVGLIALGVLRDRGTSKDAEQ